MKHTVDSMNDTLNTIMLEIFQERRADLEARRSELEQIVTKVKRAEYTAEEAPAVLARIKELGKVRK
jgi:hypothetical protein